MCRQKIGSSSAKCHKTAVPVFFLLKPKKSSKSPRVVQKWTSVKNAVDKGEKLMVLEWGAVQ